MPLLIAFTISGILFAISLIHVYWAFGGKKGVHLAIPVVEGSKAFTPGALITLLVAAALAVFALLSLSLTDAIATPQTLKNYIEWMALFVGAIFVLRAVGDFNLVGFSKKNQQGQFARLDTWLYSPLCLCVGAGYFYLAWGMK
ncbi:DUF3995 domain-containing protein [Vibrio sp. SCSIO 43140]|uniref:DUF3995 domain-containing protein n=1 Tax=Vibrio sp. SCSIO 43140 TaxID=2819100 RepID=UPI00207533FF|nr:DUF3995 domain-containing protein [Vibrio sp. SCSIO 43140]USD61650.1 DUF3995 domain-containing protein [Vibrio sp. SCSIO 43140]